MIPFLKRKGIFFNRRRKCRPALLGVILPPARLFMLIVALMRNHLILQKKTFKRYCIVISFLFPQLAAIAQQKNTFYTDSLFKKIADTSIRLYAQSRPYYIIVWNKDMPRNIAVIRQLDESSAIVELNSQSAIDSLKQKIRIAAANNQWKFAPGVANAVEKSKNEERAFILT